MCKIALLRRFLFIDQGEENASNPPPVDRWIYLLLIGGLIVRFFFALTAENFDHPDELFQYLEPAHRLVFGYGVVTWDFRFGARSWLVPFIVSAPLFLCKALHLDQPEIYVPLVKFCFCALSTSLIFSSYIIGRNLASEKAGMLSAILCAFWYELAYFSFRPLPDVVSAYALVAALACIVDRRWQGRPILFGVCVALAAGIRLQYAPMSIFLCLVAALVWPKPTLTKAGLALVASVTVLGFIDYLTWGQWFAFARNTFLFNLVYDIGVLFQESSPWWWYLMALVSASAGVLFAALLFSTKYFRRLWLPIIFIVLVVLTHSCIGVKNYRFIFAVVPLLLTVASSSIVLLASEKQLPMEKVYLSVIGAAIAISVLGFLTFLPNQRSVYRFCPLWLHETGVDAFKFLAQRNNTQAIAIDPRLWYATGGYYYLHKNVPLYVVGVHFGSFAEAYPYVSQIICPVDIDCTPFQPLVQFGYVEVAEQIKAKYAKLDAYSHDFLQPGIDDKYVPTVHPFLRTK